MAVYNSNFTAAQIEQAVDNSLNLATTTTTVSIAGGETYDVLWKIAPSAATEDVYGIATSPSTGMLVRIHYFYETQSYDVEPYSPTGTDVDVDNEHRLVFTKTE